MRAVCRPALVGQLRVFWGLTDPLARAQAQTRLAQVLGEQGLEHLGTQFRIPLFNHFYRQR